MQTALIIVVVAVLALTVASLAWGVVSMGRGGDFDQKHSHQFMFARVAFHAVAVAIALFTLYLFMG